MDKIAANSEADWFGDWSGDIRAAVNARVSTIAAAGALPVLVAYNIPQRDCGSYSAGGSGSPDAYRTWIRNFAAGIGSRAAAVILEPDAAMLTDCLSSADQATRFSLLADAVSVLSANAGTAVYVDAGNLGWRTPSDVAARLQKSGIAKARGFALNVSNFFTTADTASYGLQVSNLVSSKPFVIDTSRNGLGATGDWCNPPGRALGARPGSAVPNARVDALLWIKRVGESDGTCNGGPSAGTWWPDYALGLAKRAAW
jgi:endoglucanase